MNATDQVRELLDTNDLRVTAHIGADVLFGDECDHCTRRAVILTETVIELAYGAIREGGIYCLNHGIAAVDDQTFGDATEINVTVPATLLAGYGALAA
jgi:hypothetical protein